MNIKKYKKIIFLFSILFFLSVKTIFAASVYIEPNYSEVKVGDIVTVNVYVNSDGQAINNVEGLISISSEVVEIQSVSTSGSSLNLWVEPPTYSQNSVTFNGGLPNPGYTGSKGKVVTIFMKALQAGSASINFQSAAVRANDGLGTNVLNSKYGATVNVISNSYTPPVEPTAPIYSANLPSAPVVSSSLTQDSEKWYNTKTTTFSWNLPNDVIAVKTLLGEHVDSEPSILYSPAISKKTVENLEDGIWYFHIRYQNENGWGKITHKKIQIDNTPPEVTSSTYRILDNGDVELSISSTDKTSSITKYVLSTEGKNNIEITDVDENGNAKIIFPTDYNGEKEIRIEAFDEAGNFGTAFIKIAFPIVDTGKGLVEDVKTEAGYLVWGNKILEFLSVFVPIIAIIVFLISLVYLMISKLILADRRKENKIRKIEKEMSSIIKVLKDDLSEEIKLLKSDKNIDDVSEIEKVMWSNLLSDVKNIQKVINAKIRKNKLSKKEEDLG